jgi:rare lipoprotein A
MRSTPAILTVSLGLAGCSVFGYPGGAPVPTVSAVGTGSERGSEQGEPRSRRGNPREYEVFGVRYRVLDSAEGYDETGVASWYGREFHGRSTSSGEPYDMNGMTAAHRTLPLPTYVEVTNLENGRVAVVRVNDRGPFHDDRLIDLSYAAALELGIVGSGTARVRVRALTRVSG